MKTWFITGTSSGFGRVLTEKLLEKGDRVAATVRNSAVLDELKEKYKELLWVATLDVTDTLAIKTVVDRAFAELGHIDVIVNNAGYALFCAAEEAADNQILQQINTNVIGSIQVIRAALPHLRLQGGGRILQLSSANGQMTFPGFSYYQTSKWAIEGFCETLATEVAPFNIGVTIVEPGAHPTGFVSGMVTAPVMDEYDQTPVGYIRRAAAAGEFPVKGDVNKAVDAMIATIGFNPAPIRLALGNDAYTLIRAALVERLEQLDAQKELAISIEMN